MTEQTVFLFPAINGYQFVPSDTSFRAEILSMLSAKQSEYFNQESIQPFLSAKWMGGNRFFPKSRAIFIVGLMTSGIQNDVHRGSCSMWVAARVIKSKMSFSEQDAVSQFSKIYEEFVDVIKKDASSDMLVALNTYVTPYIGRHRVDEALQLLHAKLGDKRILAGVSAIPSS